MKTVAESTALAVLVIALSFMAGQAFAAEPEELPAPEIEEPKAEEPNAAEQPKVQEEQRPARRSRDERPLTWQEFGLSVARRAQQLGYRMAQRSQGFGAEMAGEGREFGLSIAREAQELARRRYSVPRTAPLRTAPRAPAPQAAPPSEAHPHPSSPADHWIEFGFSIAREALDFAEDTARRHTRDAPENLR